MSACDVAACEEPLFMPFAMDDVPGHATPSAAQFDALVAELERVGPRLAPDREQRWRQCVQRVDVLLWSPQATAEMCTRLLLALTGARLRWCDAARAPHRADALLWVNARGVPLVVRIRDTRECFATVRPAPRVVLCTPPYAEACACDAFAALASTRAFDGVELRLLHWAGTPVPPALETRCARVPQQPEARSVVARCKSPEARTRQ